MAVPKLISFPERMTGGRRREEREFLPAALEIIETPVSPTGRIMMGVVGLLMVVAIAWACVGQLDIVATANGRVIPSGQIKLIQPLEIGVVKKISVADGDHVAAGDVLIELDPTADAADRDKSAHNLMQAKLDIARLTAVLSGDAENFKSFAGAETLEKSKLTSVINKIEAQRQLVEAGHDRVAAVHQVEGAEAQIAGLTQQLTEAIADFRRQALDDLRKASQYAAEQQEELIKATKRTSLQVLCSPVDGTVEQLSVHTIGGVVQPAQTLMVIVPDGSKLEVEAMLPNRDVGFVHAGQLAELKIEAFTFTRYGLLHGQVRDVSRDAVRNARSASSSEPGEEAQKSQPRDEQNTTSSDPTYVARISLAETSVETEQGSIPLGPGMTVTAEIKTGQRSIIQYLLSPFMRYRHGALRER